VLNIVPEFQIGLWNGWWFSLVYLAVSVGLLALYPKHVAKRLFTWPEMSKTEWVIARIESVLYYGIIVYAVFVPLKLGTAWLYTGLVVFGLGMIGNLTATANFASTPPDQPAVEGLYRISRNPCHVTSFVAWLGVGIATASWVIIVADVVMNLLMHVTTLAEERFCLEKYGQLYREYMQKVPRYFLFF
jgi:protein-S-isoprenylcysteine O-methyltransferase Ste14